jgi:hypothetical protein
MKYHVVRLMPPRATFIADMSPRERALMEEHSVYWRRLVADGMVVIVGPVLDAAGPYGLCVLRLKDGLDPGPICTGEPVVKAGIGFRFEVAPMASAIVPESP